MMNPQQPRGIDEKDMERAIEAYTGTEISKKNFKVKQEKARKF